MRFDRLATSRQRHDTTRSGGQFQEFDHDGAVCASFPNSSAVKSILESTPNPDAISAACLAERTRIAQELHDTLLQGFLGVSMQLHSAVDNLSAESADKQRFSSLLQLLDRVLEQGRRRRRGIAIDYRAHWLFRRGLCRCSDRSGTSVGGRFSSGCTRQGAGIAGGAA